MDKGQTLPTTAAPVRGTALGSLVLPTLMYHRVAPAVDCPYNVTPAVLACHLQALTVSYRVLTAAAGLALIQAIKTGHAAGVTQPMAVILTFDDGYADFFHYALPLLQQYAATATIFLPTAYLGQTNRWNPRANYVCDHLTWSQVTQAAASGIELGAHSRHHHSLLKYSAAELEDEVSGAAQDILHYVGIAPTAFSYPYGVFNSLVQAIVARHYDLAFTITAGTVDWQANRHALNRLYISNQMTGIEVVAKVAALLNRQGEAPSAGGEIEPCP